MLQASEYHIRDYFAWYHGVKDFAHVEKRKHLVKTRKAMLLLALCWVIIACLLGAALYVLLTGAAPMKYAVSFFILLLWPYVLAYGIVIPLVLAEIFVQKPIERVIIRNAQLKLQNHKAIKIGIAGSFGKTTMREILKTVLSEGKKVAAPPHSYNTPLGISQFADMLDGDEDILIFELGEYYPGDVRKLCNLVQPDMGVITGVNEAHLEKFKTLEKTVGTIFELGDYLGEKRTYVNGESDLARKSVRMGHIIYERTGVGDWKIKNCKTGLEGTSFTLERSDITLELKSGLLGLHQIGPLAAGVDLALSLGLSPEQVRAGIGNTKPFDHRLEPKTDSAGVVTLDDSYNGNPDGVKAVIDFLAFLTGHRRFYVTPGLVEMGVRTEEIHKEIGRSLARSHIEKVILIRNSVTAFIEEGLREAGYKGEIIWFDDALSAFGALPHMTVKGDVVLLQNDWPDQYQ